MLPSLLVAATLTAPGAPVPKDSVPNTTGPAPRVATVKADQNGSVWITAYVYQKQKVQQQMWVNENGQNVMKMQEVEQVMNNYVRKQLTEYSKFTTADGTPLTAEEATRRVKDGNTLLITADGKPVDKGWLKAVSSDTVILVADGLGEAYFVHGNGPYPTTAAPRLVMLGTDDKGEVRMPVNANANQNGQMYYGEFNGGRGGFRGKAVQFQDVQIAGIDGGYAPPSTPTTPPGADGKKALADIKFDAYDTTGKLMPRAEALTRLKAGGLIVLAGDNRFPDADYLRTFRDDLIVITSPELVFPQGQQNPYDRPSNTKVGGGVPAQQLDGPLRPAIAVPAAQLKIQRAIQVEK